MNWSKFLKPNSKKIKYALFFVTLPIVICVLVMFLGMLIPSSILFTFFFPYIFVVYFSINKFFISLPLLIVVSYISACFMYESKQRKSFRPLLKSFVIFIIISLILSLLVWGYNETIGHYCNSDEDCTYGLGGSTCVEPVNTYYHYTTLNPAFFTPVLTDCLEFRFSKCENNRCVIAKDGNPKQCDHLYSSFQKDRCYLELAKISKDPSYCSMINVPDDKDYCYVYVAVKKRDPSLCEKVGESIYLDKTWKDRCYRGIALAKQDPSICGKIKDQSYKIQCYSATNQSK